MSSTIQIYTDGSAHYKTQYGAWAFVVVQDGVSIYEDVGTEKDTTNNRMELRGICAALSYILERNELGKTYEIITDSQYAYYGLTTWRKSWKLKDWKNVKNADLWQNLDRVVDALPTFGLPVSFLWVRGHAGNKFNEQVDKLAHAAFQKLTASEGGSRSVG